MKKIPSPVLFAGTLLIWLAGCTAQAPGIAAPLGDNAALEKLARAYEKTSEAIHVSPVKLKPEARRKFVEQVFRESGYGYSETLLELAKIQPATINQLHRDMKDLLFMPHYGVNFEETKQIYSETELKAIATIKKNFG